MPSFIQAFITPTVSQTHLSQTIPTYTIPFLSGTERTGQWWAATSNYHTNAVTVPWWMDSQGMTRHWLNEYEDPQIISRSIISSPAVLASIQRDCQRRDEEQYRRAKAECNEQEATRIRLLIEHREQMVAEQRAREEAIRQQAIEARQRQELADTRAKELLLEHLTPAQRDTYTKNGWFIVKGGRTGRDYRIRTSSISGNVDVYEGGKVLHRLCAHVPSGRIPIGDNLLAQKLMLEFNEDEFVRIANRH